MEQAKTVNKPRRRAKTTARAIERADFVAQVLALRCSGLKVQEIGQRLGIGHPAVVKIIKAALAKTVEEPTADLRALSVERIETLWRETVEVVEKARARAMRSPRYTLTYLRAMEVMCKLDERRAKLLGLDQFSEADRMMRGNPVSFQVNFVKPGEIDITPPPDRLPAPEADQEAEEVE